ncbi:C25 family cysteine peptidase [Verrucomicrobiaceae bacterium 227]
MKAFCLISLVSASVLSAREARVLLVSPPELKEAWEGYTKARGEQGTAMKVVTTAEIAKKYEAGDLAEKIRLCAREHIEKEKFDTVILGGDSTPDGGLIPDRDTFHKNMWGNDTDIPTDIYFISPTNWDHDGDGIYGEWKDDQKAISYPDGKIAIGRIPVRSAEDIAAYGVKVKNYLESEVSDELALTCAVPGANAKVYRSGHEIIPAAWKDGKVSFFFNGMTSWDEGKKGSYDLSNKNLLEKLNEGVITKWHFHGHGLVDRWVLENDESFTAEQVGKLTNLKHPAVITTVSCFTGQFDGKKDPSIAESMLRHPGGGAVAIVAPAREGKPHFHDPKKDFPLMVREGKLDGTTQTMASFWVAGLGGKATTGMALMKSKAGLAEDAKKSATYHQGMCELNLLGDPSLPVK